MLIVKMLYAFQLKSVPCKIKSRLGDPEAYMFVLLVCVCRRESSPDLTNCVRVKSTHHNLGHPGVHTDCQFLTGLWGRCKAIIRMIVVNYDPMT